MDFDLRSASEVYSKSKIHLSDELQLGERTLTVPEIIAKLEPMLLSERVEKLKAVVDQRSLKVITVLENIYDRGNVSAVMRTAESLGFFRFVLIEQEGAKFKAANRVTKGAEKWLDVEVSRSTHMSVEKLKSQNYLIAGTDLNATHELSHLPTDQPIALVIGNEKDGISEEMKSNVDIRIKIPMVGFSQSYNLSVASALCLFELYKKWGVKRFLSESEKQQLYANYLLRCFDHPEKYFS